MIRPLLALCASAVAFISVSCCCTGESAAPRLHALPKFKEIEAAPPVTAEVPAMPSHPGAPKVHPEK